MKPFPRLFHRHRGMACACLLLTVLSFFLFSCSGNKQYQNNISCAELADAAEDQIPVNFGYETCSSDHLRYYFENTDHHDDACLRYSVLSENINEFGIFHAADDASLREIVRLTESYLAQMQQDQSAFLANYAAEELPKLEQAEIRTFGNYVVYTILNEHDRQLVFETIEKKLCEEK